MTTKKTLCSFLFLLITSVAFLTGCSKTEEQATTAKNAGPLEHVTLSYAPPLSPLMLLADEKGFFRSEGLDVRLEVVDLGKTAMDRMLRGEVEFSVNAETPIVLYSFKRSDYRILASLRSSDNLCLIGARKDRGIRTPADLKGRRIGITRNTAPHYFLDQFLVKNGIAVKSIIYVPLAGKDLPAALKDGTVDAIASTNFHVRRTAAQLGDRAIVFGSKGLCYNDVSLLAMKSYIDSHPDTVERLLRAFLSAERYLARRPEESRKLYAERTKAPSEELDALWNETSHELTLNSVMLMTLKNQARWALENGFVQGKEPPDFRALIHEDTLKRLAPAAVRFNR